MGAPCGAGGYRWGFPETWWYGLTQAFAANSTATVRCRNCTEFEITGQASNDRENAWFGVELEWNTTLSQNTAYQFVVSFLNDSELPHLSTANGEIVWRRTDGFAAAKEVHLHCVPGRRVAKPTIQLIYRAGAEPRTVNLLASWNARKLRLEKAPFAGTRPENPAFDMPENVTYTVENAQTRAILCHDTYNVPAEYARPALPDLDRPVADVVVCQRGIDPAKGGSYLQMADVRTLMFQPIPWRNETVFSRWADAAIHAGVRDLIIPPVLNICGTYDPKWEEDGYRFYHLHSLMAKGAGQIWKYRPDWGANVNRKMNEIPIFDQKAGHLTGWGPMWFDFIRYAKLHPPRGEGQARIAVMRGFGDEWNLVGGPSAGGNSRRCLPLGEMLRPLKDKSAVTTWVTKTENVRERRHDLIPNPLNFPMYHNVQATRRVLDWVEQQDWADKERFGAVGISYGGWLSFILAGVDPRIRSVYTGVSTATGLPNFLKDTHPCEDWPISPPSMSTVVPFLQT